MYTGSNLVDHSCSRLPYMQEALYYMLAIDVDLCTAGELKDSENGKFIKKTLTILSTSQ